MKTLGFCLLILSLSVLQLKAQLDYTSDFTTGSCASEAVIQSPVTFQSSKCEAYEAFSINLPEASGSGTFQQNKGTYSLGYTTGKMTVNSHKYETLNILFRVPSEHKLPNQGSGQSMEVQIELAREGETTVAAVLALIFVAEGTNQGRINSKKMLDVLTGFSNTATGITLKLDTFTQKINAKISSGEMFLNLFTYAGTLTYPPCTPVLWYVYGSPLVTTGALITAVTTALEASETANDVTLRGTENANNRPTSESMEAVRLCYTGYFKNYMNYNYGLWFGVVIIVFWFIINLMLSEKPIKDSEYQENTWTNHPLYSVYHVGNDLFTRKTRMALILGTLTIHALFSSVWYRRTDDPLRKSNLIVYAIYSMLIDWAFIFIIGSMLRGYYVAKHQFYKTKEEAWQQKSQNRLFAFYFCIFLCAVVLWPFCVWNMSELHPEKDDRASDYWVASFFIGLGLEFLIVDPIICLLAKSITPLRNFIKHRGYMYDNICHETYLDHLKFD